MSCSCSGEMVAPQLFKPPLQRRLMAGLDIQEFQPHSYAWLDDSNDCQSVNHLLFQPQSQSHPAACRQGLAGAHKASTHRKIGGHTLRSGAGFEVQI